MAFSSDLAILGEDGFADSSGVRIHYVTKGAGPLVVLIHGIPGFWYDWRHQIPALAERGRLRLQHFFAWLDVRLADNEFVCGPHFTIADISGMVAVDFSAWAKLRPPEHLGHLKRWYKDVSTRPSAKA